MKTDAGLLKLKDEIIEMKRFLDRDEACPRTSIRERVLDFLDREAAYCEGELAAKRRRS